jgi:16S rRNA (cytosine967-C5)-methyltransferase
VAAAMIAKLAERQRQQLEVACAGVRPGGTLVYTVATVTRTETVAVIENFLRAHSEFHLDAFAHPLEEGTTSGMLQIWPQAQDGEARFIARMVRVPDAKPAKRASAPAKPKATEVAKPGDVSDQSPEPTES